MMAKKVKFWGKIYLKKLSAIHYLKTKVLLYTNSKNADQRTEVIYMHKKDRLPNLAT